MTRDQDCPGSALHTAPPCAAACECPIVPHWDCDNSYPAEGLWPDLQLNIIGNHILIFTGSLSQSNLHKCILNYSTCHLLPISIGRAPCFCVDGDWECFDPLPLLHTTWHQITAVSLTINTALSLLMAVKIIGNVWGGGGSNNCHLLLKRFSASVNRNRWCTQ